MLLTDNHFTVVIGIDIHFTMMPPYNPFHPYIGMVLDPMDYIPFVGGTVNINGIKRGVSDTSGIIIPLVHIPLFMPPWVMAPIIGHESMNFFASKNVYADGSRLSPKGYMVMTCNDIGIPLSIQPGKKKFWKVVPTLFAPTSFSLPIPTGPAVNVGGPYVPDWAGFAKMLVMGFGFGAIMKYGKKYFNKLLKKAKGPNSLSDALCHAGFDPVNLVNGASLYDGTDFTLPGPIPFEWKRRWYSDSNYVGLLGHGCHWQYDRELRYYAEDEAWGLRMADGRVVAVPDIAEGDSFYLRQEKITISNCYDRFEVYHHEENLNYVFTPQGVKYYKLTKITREGGTEINFDYEGFRLNTIRDSAGRKIAIESDRENRICSATVSIGPLTEKKIRYTYDAQGNMLAITDALGKSTRMEFAEHKMIKKTDRNGQSFYWSYDEHGRCIHTWGDGGLQEGWLAYYPEKGYNKITETGGATSIYHYDENQLVERIENAMGASKIFQYTEYMELYREVDEDGHITGYTYDDRGMMTSVAFPDGTAERYMYDDQGRLKIKISPSGKQEVYTYYENSNLLRAVIHPDRQVTKYAYNEFGLPQSIKKGDKLMELSYDWCHNLVELKSQEQRSKWYYSLLGEVLRVEDMAGREDCYTYDKLGRVDTILQANGGIQLFKYNAYDEIVAVIREGEKVASFDYTPLGSLLKRKQGNTQMRFSYDRMERLIQVQNEHSESYTFTRNKAGEVIAETGFDKLTKHYQRSPAGRVQGVKGPGGLDTKYRYNGKGQLIYTDYADGSWESYSYDKDGLLIAAQNEHSHVALKRDRNGHVVQESQSSGIADQGHRIDSVYDEDGQRLHIASSLGADIRQEYNVLGQVKQIQANTSDALWEAHIARDGHGQVTAYSFTGGVRSVLEYDRAGRPMAHTVKDGLGRESYKRSYHWNTANQLVQNLNYIKNRGIKYDYDALAQLVSATGDITPEYKCPDEVGNLYETLDRKDRNYSPGGRMNEDKIGYYYYDALGNLSSKSPYPLQGKEVDKKGLPHCWYYEWYANGMLKSVSKPNGKVVSFEYDALGRRIRKLANGKIYRYLWDSNVLLQEWSYDVDEKPILQVGELGELFYDRVEPVADITTWVYEADSFTPIAKLVNGQRFSIVSDYLGTPIQAFDSAGMLVWERELNIYGGIRSETGISNFVAMRYQGQYFDSETALCYNRFRYYDPSLGNYISQDPIGLAGGAALYGYVHDSNSWVDVFGLFFGKVIGNAQKTGTFGHSTISKIIANIYSLDPRVQRVTMDLGYKKLLGGGNFKYGPRPDVGVLYNSGKVKIFEVASKTDKIADLISRNIRFMQRNNIKGDVKVNRLAQFMEKVKSKFKPKCK